MDIPEPLKIPDVKHMAQLLKMLGQSVSESQIREFNDPATLPTQPKRPC